MAAETSHPKDRRAGGNSLPASARLVRDPGGAVYVSPEPAPELADIYFFTRLGGVSEAPFDELNVSAKHGDDLRNVEENLGRIRAATGGNPAAHVRQVAGDEVLRVEKSGFAGEADGLITSALGLPLVVGVADCVPVALVGPDGVAMVHSGWRGTLAGVSGKAASMMGAGELTAYIGPCIRRCCYEVSGELADSFTREFGAEVARERYLSLADSIRSDLREVGVEDIHDTGLCTGCRGDLFFSHRRQKPVTGRGLAAVVRRGAPG